MKIILRCIFFFLSSAFLFNTTFLNADDAPVLICNNINYSNNVEVLTNLSKDLNYLSNELPKAIAAIENSSLNDSKDALLGPLNNMSPIITSILANMDSFDIDAFTNNATYFQTLQNDLTDYIKAVESLKNQQLPQQILNMKNRCESCQCKVGYLLGVTNPE